MKHKEREFYSEDYGKLTKMYKREKTPPKTFNLLSITKFNQRINDEVLKEHLFKEFRRFGDYHIEIVREPHGEKKAFANFRYFEDAMAVRSAYKSHSLDIDPNIVIEPAYAESPKERRSDNFNPNFSKSLRNEKNFQDDYDDKSVTRTLFVGNLEFEIRADELQLIFGKFGYIEDIDIKKNNGQSGGSVYAFIRYLNLEMARRAKYEMSGKHIGKYMCRIGYGKHVPSNCLWVGNLGPNISKEDIEKCFSNFNPVKIHYLYGRQFAYVVFSSLEVASSVLGALQGFELHPGNHIRLDFSDESHLEMLTNSIKTHEINPTKESSPKEEPFKTPVSIFESMPAALKQSFSDATTLVAVVKQITLVWKGEITLKTSTFHANIYMLCGCPKLFDKLIKQNANTNVNNLSILKKISLEHKNLKELSSFVLSDNADCCLLLVLPDEKPEKPVSTALPFKCLLNYMARKQVAGLTTLPTTSPPDQIKGTIHWLSHGTTLQTLLKQVCPKLPSEDISKENYLLAVLNTVKL